MAEIIDVDVWKGNGCSLLCKGVQAQENTLTEFAARLGVRCTVLRCVIPVVC